jgi:hypothetical protein
MKTLTMNNMVTMVTLLACFVVLLLVKQYDNVRLDNPDHGIPVKDLRPVIGKAMQVGVSDPMMLIARSVSHISAWSDDVARDFR